MRALLIVERPSVVMRGHCVVSVLSADASLHINSSGAPFVIILKALYHWLQVYLMLLHRLILCAV